MELIRAGAVTTSSELAARADGRSGLERLREVVLRQFGARARVLKARSAVAGLREIFQRDDCADGPALLHRLEQITAGAHEFEEVRILLELRGGEIAMTPGAGGRARPALADRATSRRPVSGSRTGRPRSSQGGRAGGAGPVAGGREHPLSSRAAQIAARAATRTLEGMLAS